MYQDTNRLIDTLSIFNFETRALGIFIIHICMYGIPIINTTYV